MNPLKIFSFDHPILVAIVITFSIDFAKRVDLYEAVTTSHLVEHPEGKRMFASMNEFLMQGTLKPMGTGTAVMSYDCS